MIDVVYTSIGPEIGLTVKTSLSVMEKMEKMGKWGKWGKMRKMRKWGK